MSSLSKDNSANIIFLSVDLSACDVRDIVDEESYELAVEIQEAFELELQALPAREN